ncbi:hypothetical protein [Demequina sp.]|uniref:hypothetical protein n=1 Tax=Demequina sp. TaxID=2050685 RepID=UPI003D09B163
MKAVHFALASALAIVLTSAASAAATPASAPDVPEVEPGTANSPSTVLQVCDVSLETAQILDHMTQVGLRGLSDNEFEVLARSIEPGQTVFVPIRDADTSSAEAGALAALSPKASAQSALKPNIPKTDCEAKPSNIHLRKSGNYGVVGVKPTTVCGTWKQALSIETALRKYRMIPGTGSSLVEYWDNGNAQQAAYRPTNREVKCTNTKATTWVALHTHIVLLWNDCPYALVTRSPDARLNCGT